MDIPYKRVDDKIKAAITAAVQEMCYYKITNVDPEFCAAMTAKYETVIACLVAAQQVGEQLFGGKE